MLRSLLFTVGCAALAVGSYLFGKRNMTAVGMGSHIYWRGFRCCRDKLLGRKARLLPLCAMCLSAAGAHDGSSIVPRAA